MGKSIKKNYVYNAGYQILLILVPLVTTPYISRVLGADQIGRYSYVNSIASYFVLFATLGITTYGRREISYVQDDRISRSRVFWETKMLQVITSGLSAVVFLGFSLLQNDWIFYLVFILNILAITVDVTWFFQGVEEFGKIVFRNSACKIANLAYIFLMVRGKEDLILYVFGLVFFPFLSNLTLIFCLPGYIEKPKWSQIKPFRDIGTVFSLFIPTIAIEIYTVLDKTMIGLITHDSFENGYYEMAIRISKMSLSILTALWPVMIPRVGYYFQRKNREVVQNLMYRGYQFVWFLGVPMCLGLVGISENFVPWFFGDGFEKISILLYLLSFLILAIGVNTLTGNQYLIPTKRQNHYTFTVILGAVTNFTMNLVLIPRLQSIGAAIASVAAETLIAVLQLYIIRKELSMRKVFSCGAHYWIAGLVMLLILAFENRMFSPSIIHTAIMVISGGAVYVLMLCCLRDEFFLSNVHSVWKALRNLL